MFERLEIAALGGALCLAVGFGGGVAWEHRPELPWPASMLGKGLAAQRAAEHDLAALNAANWRSMRDDRDGWKRADVQCEAARKAETGRAASAIEDAADLRAAAASGAFNQGYAVGRVAGRKTCGASDGTINPPGGLPGAVAGVGGVRDQGDDFANGWNVGAYKPGGAVPAGP